MKLEEILPEIRKGRRFKRSGWLDFTSTEYLWHTTMDVSGISADDWILEPLPAPKMKAWINSNGVAHFFTSENVGYDLSQWIRAEWLDSP